MKAIHFISLLLLSVLYFCEWSSADSHTGFAIDLYKKIASSNNGKNIFFSPISISTAFGMVRLGADGNTNAQLKTVLKLNSFSSDGAINQEFERLLTSLKHLGDNYTLNVVNRLFGSNEFTFEIEFLKSSPQFFNASLESLDFKHKAEESRLRINNWVSEQTNEKIKDLLSGGSIDSQTTLVIVNAIYFHAAWKFPFHPTTTRPGPFKISNSEEEQMDMMHLHQEHLKYYNSEELNSEILELPYLGDKASMFIVLPHDFNGLLRLEATLNTTTLNDELSKVQVKVVNVKIPKFQMDLSIPLKQFLQSLGMTDVFDMRRSNLSGISATRQLYATDAAHKTYISVSEYGTEAAGASAVVIRPMSGFFGDVINFNADRPFLFMITAKDANTVLFLGRFVRSPTANQVIGRFGESAPFSGSGCQISSSQLGIWSILVILSSMLMH